VAAPTVDVCDEADAAAVALAARDGRGWVAGHGRLLDVRWAIFIPIVLSGRSSLVLIHSGGQIPEMAAARKIPLGRRKEGYGVNAPASAESAGLAQI
jgi:hypothetical protein